MHASNQLKPSLPELEVEDTIAPGATVARFHELGGEHEDAQVVGCEPSFEALFV